MKKTACIAQTVGCVLFLFLTCNAAYTQELAVNRPHEFPEQTQRAQEKQSLLKVLNEVKSHYRISLLFQKRNVSGITVDGVPAFDLPVEQLLHNLLQPFNLRFEKTAANTYVIYPASQEEQASKSSTSKVDNITNQEQSSPESKQELALIVKGRVTDETGNGLAGVSIIEKGTTNGTTSNGSGDFSISVKSETSVLQFSYIGYANAEITVGSQVQMRIQLQKNIQKNDEVVVVAYGSRLKKDLTGAVSSIGASDISKSPALSPQLALQGRMPGVFVSAAGGDPNSAPTIRIRGVTTFSGTNADPLYVIDGVISDEYGSRSTFTISQQKAGDIKGSQNIFNLINPNDIESISVLKDASSAAAYGARAANGVVLITTKRGKEGRARVSASADRGFANVIKKMNVLNTKQYVDIVNESEAGDPNFADPKYDIYKPSSPKYLGNANTYDWQKAIINKDAVIEDYNLSVSGGTSNSNYYVAGGYAHQESDLKFNEQKRYTLSTRTEFKLNRFFEVGQTLRLAYTDMNDNRDNTGVPVNLFNAYRVQPFVAFYGDGPNGYNPTVDASGAPKYVTTAQNFLGVSSVANKNLGTFKTLGNVYATLIPVKGLRITGTISGDYYTGRRLSWALATIAKFNGNGTSTGNGLQEVQTTNFMFQKRLSAEYSFTVSNHSFNIYVHGEEQKSKFHSTDASRSGIPDITDPDLFTVSGSTASATTYKDYNAYLNYLGRLSYKYKDKYYLDVTVLRQGSSIFNPDGYQFGTFPSVAAAWRISRERFMEGLPFQDLKLKLGYGQLGNSDTKGWQYLALVDNINPAYHLGGAPVLGAVLTNYPNTHLTWEKVTTYNAGLEGNISDFYFLLEYYKRVTTNILQPYNLPATVGVSVLPYKNIGGVENSGIEFSLNYNHKFGQVNINLGGNITTTKNKVTALNGNTPVTTPSGYVVLGDPINSIYGYRTNGVIKTAKQLQDYQAKYAGSPYVSGLQLGDLMYQDVAGPSNDADVKAGHTHNAKPDGKVDNWDGTARLGKTIPGFFYGINLSADYQGFDLSLLFQGVGDVQRVNSVRQTGISYGLDNKLTDVLNRWTPTNSNSNMPRAIAYGASSNNNGYFSDRFVESGAFLRFANFQLGYSLPRKLVERSKFVSSCRIFVSGSNLFVITKYTGFDPENDLVPPPRILMAGINVSL